MCGQRQSQVVRKMCTTTRFLLVRHCEATRQDEDAPLTARGMEQSRRLTTVLQRFEIDAIVSSPYKRALTSIAGLATITNIPLQMDSRLGERVLSPVWLKDSDQWLAALRKSFADWDYELPGGESSRTATNRAIDVLREWSSKHLSTLVVVTHGNLLTLILKHFDNRIGYEDWKVMTNPDVYSIEVQPDSTVNITRVWQE